MARIHVLSMFNIKTMKKISLIKLIILLLLFKKLTYAQDYHWQFNDNQVKTTVGFEVNLSGTAPEMFIPGKINKSIKFNGYQTFSPYSEDVSIGTNGNYSISFWINPSYTRKQANSEHFIANKRQGQQQFQVFIDRLNRLQFFLYGTINQSLRITCNKKIPLNRWSHITITVSNKANDRFVTIFFNGNQVNKQPYYFSPNTATSKIVFGSKENNGSINKNFNGSIDDFRINGGRVISYEEVQSLANKNQAPDYRWKFDEYITESESFYSLNYVKDYIGYRDGKIIGEIPRVSGKVGFSAIRIKPNELNYITIDSVETSNTKNYSLSFWIKAKNRPTSKYTILRKRESKNQYQVNLLSSGVIRFHLWGSSHHFIDSTPLNSDWNNIIIVVNNTDKKTLIYKNGIIESELSFNFEPWYGIDKMIIGDKDNQSSVELLLDDLRIYNNKIVDSNTINKILKPSELISQNNNPIEYENYSKTEFRQYGYDPNFIPGPLSFDLDNVPYIRKENYIQTLEGNKWYRIYFTDVIKNDSKYDNFKMIYSERFDTRVIFDDEGWAYTFVSLKHNNGDFKSVVLYSNDILNKYKEWKILELDDNGKLGLWETKQVHNDLSYAPVLIQAKNSSVQPIELIVTFFRKEQSGILVEDKNNNISIDNATMGSIHSGASQKIVTKDNNSFLIYTKESCFENNEKKYNCTYVMQINRENNLRDDIFIGNIPNIKKDENGNEEDRGYDNHHYGSIVIDSNGFLHVVLSGHHKQYLQYYKSKIPYSISQWENEKKFGGSQNKGGGISENNGHTYNSLICDKNDKLHCTTRWSGKGYYFRLGYLTKEINNDWSNISEIVNPFEPYYHKWFQKLTIDRNNNLFLNYQLLHDRNISDEASYVYNLEWPEEDIFSWDYELGSHNGNMRPKHPSILKLKSGDTSWKLAGTSDFDLP